MGIEAHTAPESLRETASPVLSVVVPARDEAPNLSRLVAEVRAALAPTGLAWELIVVDDASDDATGATLEALAAVEPRVRPIRLSRPSGQTAALAAGFRAARGALVATLDADLQCSADELPMLLALIGDADLACGIRRARHDPLSRRIASAISNLVRRSLLAPGLRDLACPVRVFRREALQRVTAMTPLFDGSHRWLPALFHLAGLRVVQRSVTHHPRTAGLSKYTTGNRIRPVARELLIVLHLAVGRSPALGLVAGLLLATLLALPFLFRLGAWPLIEPDEGRNAEVAREMLALGQWAVPHFDFLPYLDKPVLLFWAIAEAFRVLGVSEFAARLPSALSAIATIVLTGLLGRRLLGSRGGIRAAIVVATVPLVLAFGRLVIFDMPLTALVTATLWCLVEARLDGNARRWWPLAGMFMGLATLTKGPVGIALPLIVWGAARGALRPARRRGDWLSFVLAVMVVGALVVPWLVIVERDQPGFLRYAVVDETVLRLVSPSRFRRAGPPWYYLVMLTWVLGAWGVVLAATAPVLLRRRRSGTRDGEAVAFASRGAAAMLIFFTLSASKRVGYILPAMVPLSLLVAAGVGAVPTRAMAAVRMMGMATVVLGVAAVGAGLAGVSTRAEGVSVVTPSLLLTTGAFVALWGVGAFVFGARRLWAAIFTCAVFAPGLGWAAFRPLTTYAESRSARPIADRIPPGARVIAFRVFREGLPFYLRRPVTLASDSASQLTSNYIIASRDRLRDRPESLVPESALADVLGSQDGPVYVLTAPSAMARLRRLSGRTFVRVYDHGRAILVEPAR